jgi:hypothetical protein
VNRRLLTILLPLAAVAAGCTTFSDNDAAARVDDTELTTEVLEELVVLIPDPQSGAPGEPEDANAVRNALTFWIQTQVLGDIIDSGGIEITDATIDEATQQASSQLATFGELSSDSQAFLVDYFAVASVVDQLEPADEDERAAFYDRGMVESGIACVSHILVDTEDEARDVLDELEGGADFAAVAQERSTDPASGSLGGGLPCSLTSTFEATYAPPFVEAALAADIGVPVGPVETEFGFHVIRVRTIDEVGDELGTYFASSDFAVASVIGDRDIYIDPRYGTLDARGVVVPLG